MNHPVGTFSSGNKRIQRPGCSPHDIRPCLIVLWILNGNSRTVNHRFHQCLADIIAGIVILPREILLADMIENIINSSHHLLLRQCKSEFRVQDCKLWHHSISKHMTDFQLLIMIRNYRASIHFASCSHHSQYTANRDNLTIRLLKADIIFLPWIFVTVNRHGNRFCIVAARAAAYSQQKVHMILSGNLNTLPQFLHGRIWHHASILNDYLSVIFQ